MSTTEALTEPWPTRFARRTLRTWAILQVPYGALLVAAAVWLLPWKTHAANVALIAWGALAWLSVPGLWRGCRKGWRLAVVTGLVGLVACAVVLAAMFASLAYLRTIWGMFGAGPTIAVALLATVVFQVLGLYPALLLRALLRREVVAHLEVAEPAGVRRRMRWTLALLAALPLLCAGLVGSLYAYDAVPPLTEEQRSAAGRYVAGRLRGETAAPSEALNRISSGPGPLAVTLRRPGHAALRVQGRGGTLREQLADAAARLAPRVDDADPLAGASLRFHRTRGEAPLPAARPWAVAFSVDPGVDGLRRGERLLLPEEMLREGMLAAYTPIPGVWELRVGVDGDAALEALAPAQGPMLRVRLESWTWQEGRSRPVRRLRPETSARGPDAWRRAALDGGRYIANGLRPDGRFQMIYLPLTDMRPAPGPDYSIARHAGTVHALNQLFEATGDSTHVRVAGRALDWLGARVRRCGTPGQACVATVDEADFNATALSAVAMLGHDRATGTARWRGTARGLLEFLLARQRPDGDFVHVFDVATGQADSTRNLPFATGEAALALVLGYEVLGEARYLAAAEAALDYLVGAHYRATFLGHFVYGPDHWTCLAAAEAWPALTHRRYLDFCVDYMGFMRRIQFRAGEAPEGYAGLYGFSFLPVAQLGNAAAITEAAVATLELARRHGSDPGAVPAQIATTLDALVAGQLDADADPSLANPPRADGGIPISAIEPVVRMDNVQHAVSALLGGYALLR